MRVTASGAGALGRRIRPRGRGHHRRRVRLDELPASKITSGARGDDRRDRLHPRRRAVRRSSPAPTSRARSTPATAQLVAASDTTRGAARKARSNDLKAGGGTAIGQWLSCADELFAARAAGDPARDPAHRRRRTRTRPRRSSTPSLDVCDGHFQCDCRGVGADWEVAELREIADRSARRRRHDPRARGHGRRLHRDDGTRRWASGQRRRAAGVDAAGREHRRSSSRSRPRSRTSPTGASTSDDAARRLPDRCLGRRVARLPRLHRTCRRATSARRCSPGG